MMPIPTRTPTTPCFPPTLEPYLTFRRLPIILATLPVALLACRDDSGDTDCPYCEVCEVCDICEECDEPVVEMAMVGKLLYFDSNLSEPAGMACATCHSAEAGYADPDEEFPASEGSRPWLFGDRNSPTAAYAAYSPVFAWDEEEKLYVGGQFWDGRAADLAEQAEGPFLNVLEMNNSDEEQVVQKVKDSDYAGQFELVFGAGALDDVETAYGQIAEAIAAYESTDELNRFTSKYDYYLAGQVDLTEQEALGLELYEAEDKGNCAACHPSTSEDDTPPLFTDFTYDNLGVPKNWDNPFLYLEAEFNADGEGYIDLGLGKTLDDPAEDGKFKVPTLRNVAETAPFMHNGIFATLEEVVRFYNTRDVSEEWDAPEVADNVNSDELGDLGLTDEEVLAILVFLETLSDNYALAE